MGNINLNDIDSIKTRINQLSEECRLLTVELIELNISQFENKISKANVETKLTDLANRHIELETELCGLQKVLEKKDTEQYKRSMQN